jgi:hypothetical protein
MTPHRPLALTLLDVGEGAIAAARIAGARATRLEVDLPVEIRFTADGGFLADFPLFVTRTAFDRPPARLGVVFEETAP